MKLLVLGSGGREHALVWKLAQSPHPTHLWVASGNAGTAQEHLAANGRPVINLDLSPDNLPALLDWARDQRPDLTVVGPDNPLALGVVDLFQQHGFKIWGPNRRAAQFEASKAFSQEFMVRHGIPTARSGTFTDPVAARRFCEQLEGRCAVKADGLALGKGVLLTSSVAEAHRAVAEIMIDRAFGSAGSQVVVQELLEGIEISLHALCDGKTAKLFPTAQDHKRALDGDRGLNTGGMGTYSPAPFLSDAELGAVGRQILEPWLAGCAAEGLDFRGLLYPGVMLTEGGAKVLEFNARFGDPETQVYLTRLENDLVELLQASVDGALGSLELRWSPQASVCVVAASGGYPGEYTKGKVIHGLESLAGRSQVKVFHAGTQQREGKVVTSGGRVLGVTAWAPTLQAARDDAYAALAQVDFEGLQYRRDIAAKALPSR